MLFSPDTPLLECVPNFSEGRDDAVIAEITAAIAAVEGVALLDVDPGRATNRTVVTFVGRPDAVIEAAFRAIARAAELIDMQKHRGEHPRMGATDVCPLVPVANVTMEEAAELARRLGERVGRELDIPVYLYESAATRPERKNLADVREGEYEALPDKLKRPEWKPDHGPAEFRPRSGATVIGARNFLIAYNVNLNTTSTRRANAIAFDVREKGRVVREDGEKTRQPGSLEAVKGIGWYIEEYGVAQVSLNLNDITVTPLHAAFEEVREKARARGVRVTGSELVGLVPLAALLDAGRYFLRQQQRSVGVSESELVRLAVRSLGLDDLAPFDPARKIIEYRLRDPAARRLAGLTLEGFIDETASESVAPGGGSVAAALGALAAALGTMVANLSSHKRGWDERWEELSRWAEMGQGLKAELLAMVDEDTHAFDGLRAAFRLPRASDAEQTARDAAIAAATRHVIEVPFRVMERSLTVMELARAMVQEGLPSSVSDAAVGALAARAALRGAFLNVRINARDVAPDSPERAFVEEKLAAGATLDDRAARLEEEILELVGHKL